MQQANSFIEDELNRKETGWNMGSFGAIAEFHHVAGDPAPVKCAEPLTQVTRRGAIHFDSLSQVRLVAFETLSAKSHRWNHGIALCLPEADAIMNRRSVLTELGPDSDALRKEDKNAILFDMGLNQPQVDFCIRTTDPRLIAILREHESRPLFEHGNAAMVAILKTHPHRVAVTRLGRTEVYQLIGGPDTNGVPPVGPHTHVLPKLLSTGRSHAANVPIPADWVPSAMCHPKNPVMDQLGEDTRFDEQAFGAFQEILSQWGLDEYTATKQKVWQALSRSAKPQSAPEPKRRLGRTALRNALRQWRHMKGDSAVLRDWRTEYDRGNHDITPDNPSH